MNPPSAISPPATCIMAGVQAGTDHRASAAQGRQAGSSAATRNCSSRLAGGAGGKLLLSLKQSLWMVTNASAALRTKPPPCRASGTENPAGQTELPPTSRLSKHAKWRSKWISRPVQFLQQLHVFALQLQEIKIYFREELATFLMSDIVEKERSLKVGNPCLRVIHWYEKYNFQSQSNCTDVQLCPTRKSGCAHPSLLYTARRQTALVARTQQQQPGDPC